MSTLLMCKDVPVLEIQQNGTSIIRNYNLLPINIRKRDVNIEDFYSEWINNRAISISRTNAKAILNTLRISQTNTSAICRACHGVSLLDSYWIKDSSEKLSWEDVNLFENTLAKSLAVTALTGMSGVKENGRIHTPELTTQGVSAKAWWREGNDIYLYKVGKKELAASKILDAIGADHVVYEKVGEDTLRKIVSEDRNDFLKNNREEIVKCKLLSNINTSIVSFEEFAVYCEYDNKNPYEEVLKIDAAHYFNMQVADYIISNEDRHIGNWGFYMESDTGKLVGLHPLFDHDHAFSEDRNIMSQTTDGEESLLFAAVKAQGKAGLEIEALKLLEKPDEITQNQWNRVLENVETLRSHCLLAEEMKKNQFYLTEKLVQCYEKIREVSKKNYSLKELCKYYKESAGLTNEQLNLIDEFGNELKEQETLLPKIDEAEAKQEL